MIKVLVADHHPIIRTGLKMLLESSSDIQVIGSATTGKELFDVVGRTKPDIVLSEIDLPELNGITALRTLKKEYQDIKVIMFSSHPEEIYAVSSIKAGASGYLTKSVSTQTIKDAIMKVYSGGIYISNDLAQRLTFEERGNRPSKLYKKLSTREVEVLKLLSSGRRNKEIAEELNINEKTVSTYKARLMKKLNVTNLVDLINQSRHLELN
ncbi:MAG: response regulator transcription factor [Flavobacteriaceae bacterium]|jgi:DNA-binding NarL/FixJ family response regulator|nr:DNA-binding response regulator [Flavobacteriaceae bacterium]MCP4802448.1 response regulator transcription factor [Bacteroidota bacterium]MDB2472064.1 response regulator transcription factor [Flavobacteriaceae bacterium]MDC0957160.1 response regulator transcription factor [Flavobacteriaceae bacterium]MDC3269559.1 response regulator transcription factor [Flavobacteriaceae bacterium]|tara:strand:+ start:14305 stop:14934 length:630 start_codon:yes stop_codon:yes gene_type:complete